MEGAPDVAAPDTLSPDAALSRRRVLTILSAVMLGMFLAALDQTIVATALSTIAADLGGLEHLSWVVTSYLLASTATTALWGKLGDLYGRRIAFLAGIAIFLAGSLFCAISQTMPALIASRGLQGIGGGGLIVTAQGLIGEVVSPRERGRYQGFFGAVFGLTSVVGPVVGGFLVDVWSWHWVFLVNLPIGAVALVLGAAVLPAPRTRVTHVVDYAGAALIAAATSGIVVLTTFGETLAWWRSPTAWLLTLTTIALAAAFIGVERRAREPVLPLALFRLRNFRVASPLAFVVGIALVGPATVLPVYLQIGLGLRPTEAGLHMLPLLLAVPAASVTSGQIISRTGRYRVFPIVGTTLQLAGLFLMARGGAASAHTLSLAMILLGAGLGMTMQVLILSVQNAVDYRHLGAATSGVTLFRALGSVFGAALFGGLFTTSLGAHLAPAAALERVFTGALLFAVPSCLLAWALEEIPLRATSSAIGVDEALGLPPERRSSQQIAMLLARLVDRENRREAYERMATRAGVSLSPPLCWLLFRLGELNEPTLDTLTSQLPVDRDTLRRHLDALIAAGHVDAGARITLSPAGRDALERLVAVREARLATLLEGWSPAQSAELRELIRRLARVLVPDAPAPSLQ